MTIRILVEKNAVAVLTREPLVENALVNVNNTTTMKVVKAVNLTELPEDKKRKVLETMLPFSGHETVEEWLQAHKQYGEGEPKYAVLLAKPKIANMLRNLE